MPARDLVILLAVATGGLLLGRRLRLPPIVAYLLAGILAGPGGFGWIARSEQIGHVAEIGVTLLLFGVGIEFSLDRMRRILPRMLLSGTLQVGLTVALSALIFAWLGAAWPKAIFVGFLLSLSSTAIVFKAYHEEGVLDAPQGQAAAGILLFQDLAIIPMMLLVPVLARPGESPAAGAFTALLKAAATLTALLILARAVLPRALEMVARARTQEIFPLAALVIAFGTALGVVRLGFSPPIGAFLAGLALSGSRYAHQVFAEVLPLRDAFVAIFFTSIGMLLNPQVVGAEPAMLAGMIGLAILKGVLVGALVGWIWRSRRLAILAGFGLAQIGEFSFVLAGQGVSAGVVTPQFEQVFLAAAILTMAAAPFLMRAANRLAHWGADAAAAAPGRLEDHVLVIGYGTTGRAIARVLREMGLPFAAVDMNADNVKAGAGEKVLVRFGDATRRAVLEEMGAARARFAVVAVADPMGTLRVVSLLRQINDHLRILVRARYVGEIEELERVGADEVIPSEFETSIEILVRLLTQLGVPRHVARMQEAVMRLGHYQALRGLGSSLDLLAETEKLIAGGILENARVMEGSVACGRTLEEIDLRRHTGANVLNIVRRDEPLPGIDGGTRLEEGDLVVLYGPHEAIDRALDLFCPRATAEAPTPGPEEEEPR